MKEDDFDVDVYRRMNPDLRALPDQKLRIHFEQYSSEARLYKWVSSEVEMLSMKWLRGQGLEIGAGLNPVSTFGCTTVAYADIGGGSLFGAYPGKEKPFEIDLSGRAEASMEGAYDFVIAAHVLEHCDSFLRAIEHISQICRLGGKIFLALPDKGQLEDKNWCSDFDFDHHVSEHADPTCYGDLHDKEVLRYGVDFWRPVTSVQPPEFEALTTNSDRIPPQYRYLTHKHSYDFHGWTDLMIKSCKYLGSKLKLVDCLYGRERSECCYILERC